MVAAFQLANANLQEIWSLVLPPNSLLSLKRCSTLDPAAFVCPTVFGRGLFMTF